MYVQILFKRKIVHIKTLTSAFNAGLVQISRNIVVCVRVYVCTDLFSVVWSGTAVSYTHLVNLRESSSEFSL